MTAASSEGGFAVTGPKWLRLCVKFSPIAAVVLVWQLAVDLNPVNRQFLPSFTDTLRALWDLTRSGELIVNLVVSTYRALGGLAIGSVLGVILGMTMATSKGANQFFGPLVATTYSLPKSSLVPLFILWFGIGDITTMLTVVLACLLPVIVSTYHGVKAVPPVILWKRAGHEHR